MDLARARLGVGVLTVGSLFSGIGGFDLGFERAGFEIRWQVEIDPFCRAVLKKHWPSVRCYEDVRACGAGNLEPVDFIIGGFPCQDISFAGHGAGLDGERSGLWGEYRRIVGELRPLGLRGFVVENVAALLKRGMGRVLGDVADLGFDAEWSLLSACAVGLPHMRQRLFIVAYADSQYGRPGIRDSYTRAFRPLQAVDGFAGARARHSARLADPSALYRGADGVSDGPQRNRGIGNSVAPDVAEWIARRILAAENPDGGRGRSCR